MASEFKNLAYAIISLFAVTVVAGIIFFTVSAPYVGLVQLAVFSGAIIVLFIFVLIMTRGGVSEV
jgi:NADH:ubiquinone oxidoreductase subunit 6 (subunit J)